MGSGMAKSEARIKEFVVGKVTEAIQKVNDASLYFSGANEQLLLQQGQMMTVQAGIIEWLDKNFGRPGFTPSDQIKVICEANIARMKAEREAREAEAKGRAEEEAAKVTPCECCGAPGNTGSMPYGVYCDPCGNDVTHPTGDGSCFVRDGKEHKGRRAGYCELCGWYPPIDSEGIKTPGHICTELPASLSVDDPALYEFWKREKPTCGRCGSREKVHPLADVTEAMNGGPPRIRGWCSACETEALPPPADIAPEVPADAPADTGPSA